MSKTHTLIGGIQVSLSPVFGYTKKVGQGGVEMLPPPPPLPLSIAPYSPIFWPCVVLEMEEFINCSTA